ncbi:MAG TPA: hypothetical protein VI522_03200, partial [Gammaproteobacteria bacterium]|nr:hypothetical protein [Gammaproteobacteria bacterium]
MKSKIHKLIFTFKKVVGTKFLFAGLFALMLSACSSGDNGELVGVQGRDPWFQPDPFGTLYCPMGSYT